MKNSESDYFDIRSSQRILQENMNCQFDDNPTLFPIYELSSHGFSFLCPIELCFFRRGAFFKKVSITNIEKLELIAASGTVVHTSQFDLKNIRVGLLFEKKQHINQIKGIIRVFRHIPKIPLKIKLSAQKSEPAHPVKGIILDFTALSARAHLPKLKEYQTLRKNKKVKCEIFIDNLTLFDGTATILRARKKSGELVLKFQEDPLDVVRIEKALNVKETAQEILAQFKSLPMTHRIGDDFKALINDWRMYMAYCKQILDIEEGKNKGFSIQEKELLLQEIEATLTPPLHQFIERLNIIVDSIDDRQQKKYREYFRYNLDSFLRASKIVASSIDKLQGYPGDFKTIKLFFQSPYQGDTLYENFVNHFLHSLDAVKAHKERIDFLYNEICNAYKEVKDDLSIMILGPGPAEELIRFLKNHTLEKPVRVSLLDMDAYALADFSDRVQYISQDLFEAKLINMNILGILRSGAEDPVSGKYHLTYCAGLFDYFSQTICKRMVKYLAKHTQESGLIITTNVHKNNRSRHFMDYAGRWEITHRNEKDMADLVPRKYKWEFFYDSSGTNIIQKIFLPKHQ